MTTTEPAHETVELDAFGADLVDQLAQARAAIEGWHKVESTVKRQIVAAMGESKYGNVLGERKVTVVRTNPTRFDSTEFRNDHPDMYAEYARPGNEVVSVRLAD